MAEWEDDMAGLSPAEQYFRMCDAARAEGDEPGEQWATEAIIGGIKLYQETGGACLDAVPRNVAQEARELAMRRHGAGMPPTAMAERA
jgi:hypothetical protein